MGNENKASTHLSEDLQQAFKAALRDQPFARRSSYLAAALKEKLEREGYLGEPENNMKAVQLVSEALEAGVNVETLISAAISETAEKSA